MIITFTRGDSNLIKFQLQDKDNNILVLENGEKLYFTVKTSFEQKGYVIQKTLNSGITYENGYYSISILPSDTDSLEYGTYVYDIQTKSASIKKTWLKDKFILNEEVTFADDEEGFSV